VKAGRPTLEASGVTWRVMGGSWKKEGDALVGSAGHLQSSAPLSDGTIELDVEELGATGHVVGIGFRYGSLGDDPARSTGYRLSLSDHAFGVLRGANDYWVPINPDSRGLVKSSIVDAKKNHVVIRMKGEDVEIDVNGAALTNFHDAAYAKGHVDLWVETAEQKVAFSNVHVKS
jgi:hypothetical protein